MEHLTKPSSGSNQSIEVVPRLSLDSVLAEMLDLSNQLYKTEPLPAEVRLWQSCFQGERPEMVAFGFHEYFKTGTFPPKPADITKLIRQKRESMTASTHQPTSQEEWEACQVDRKAFFASPEYQAWLGRMNAVVDEKPDRRKWAQEQLAKFAERRNAKPAEVPSPTVEQQENSSNREHEAGARETFQHSGAGERV